MASLTPQGTRWRIVTILKKSGGSTVDELASSLSLAPMTVRQHLSVLEKDTFIEYQEVKKASGRPHFLYRLTARADELFPKGYDRLAKRLLTEISEPHTRRFNDPPSENDRLGFLFNNMADRIASEYENRVNGLTLKERVENVTKIFRDDEGTLSEWSELEDGFEIRDYNCPYYKIAIEDDHLCKWHTTLLSKMLKAEITMEQCIADGSHRCQYKIHENNERLIQRS
ncbi:MAG: ArsR family transcriptional regulator [Dehalococcoidia bacterium]|nr:ArsR family transcriptional regulator [Dehalococcoidia bacterium]